MYRIVFALISFFLINMPLSAVIKPIDQQFTDRVNLLDNPGAEFGLGAWTNSGGVTFERETGASNVSAGTSSIKWDADGSGDTLTSSLVPIPRYLYGKPCLADFHYKGADGNLTAQVWDGSSVVAYDDFTTSADYSTLTLSFTCPTSGSLALRVSAASNAAIIYLDQLFLGQREDVKKTDDYIVNGDFEKRSIKNWTMYNDGSTAEPVDCTGGTASDVSTVLNAVGAIHGNYDMKITKAAADGQGEGLSYPFTIDSYDQAKPLNIQFDYSADSGFDYGNPTDTSDPSDVSIWIYDVTNSRLIQPGPHILDASGKYSGYFQASSDSTSYRICVHNTTTSTTAWNIQIDDIEISRKNIIFGVPSTAPQEFSFTDTSSGSTLDTANSIGTWYRLGSKVYLEYDISYSSITSSGDHPNYSLPAGITIDTSKYKATTTGYYSIEGHAQLIDNTGGQTGQMGGIRYYSTPNKLVPGSTKVESTGNGGMWSIDSDSGRPINFTTGMKIHISASFYVAGWESNGGISGNESTTVIGGHYYGAPASTITNDTETYLDFDTIDYDKGGYVTGAGGGHSTTGGSGWLATIRYAGIYKVCANVQLNDTTNFNGTTEYVALYVKKNNSELLDLETRRPYAAEYYPSIGGCTILQFNSGDYFQIAYKTTVGTAVALTDSGLTTVSWSRESGPASIAQSEVVKAKYFISSTQSVSSTFVITNFDGKAQDTHNAVTTGASWKFTAPKPSNYHYCVIYSIAAIDWENSESVQLEAYTDAGFINYGARWDQQIVNDADSSSEPLYLTHCDDVELKAGEYFYIGTRHNNTNGNITLSGHASGQQTRITIYSTDN